MHGNVSEWVQDWKNSDYYRSSPSVDPAGPSSDSGSGRGLRGGDFYGYAQDVRSARRFSYWPGGRANNVGFRLLREGR